MSIDRFLSGPGVDAGPVSLAAMPLAAWVYAFSANRLCWANEAGLRFWDAGTVERLRERDLSDISLSARSRLAAIAARLAAGHVVTEIWTLYPHGRPKTVRCSMWGTEWNGDAAMTVVVLPGDETYGAMDDTVYGRILSAVATSAERFLVASHWSREIDGLLARMGDAADVDRCYCFEFDPVTGLDPVVAPETWIAHQRAEWCAPGIVPQVDNPDLQGLDMVAAGFPRWIEQFLQGNPVVANGPGQLPESERRFLEVQEIDAISVHPVIAAERLIGFIGFDICSARRLRPFTGWSAPVVEALAAGAHIAAAAISMTETRERLVQALSTAETANRTRSQFLATVSHELRTPLNAINGFSEMMVEGVLGPLENPSYAEYAGHIHRSGVFLQSLIDDVLDMAKLEAGRWEVQITNIGLPAIVQAAIDQVMAQAIRGGIEIERVLAPDLATIPGDPGAVQRMLVNLLSNAVKFTPSGGNVRITGTVGDDGTVELAVADTGIGMAAGDLALVVQPFHQVRGLTVPHGEGGTGLGLAIVKSLIELHGGRLRLSSALGHGTTATLSFPNGAAAPAAAGSSPG